MGNMKIISFYVKKMGRKNGRLLIIWVFFNKKHGKEHFFHKMVGKRLSSSRSQKSQNVYSIPPVTFTEKEEEENGPE